MKFNLKNRPKRTECRCWVCLNNVKWFEGFEKELREIISQQDSALKKVPKKMRAKGHSVNIEEILGE